MSEEWRPLEILSESNETRVGGLVSMLNFLKNLWNHSWSITRNTNDKKDNFVVSSNYLQARFSLSHQINNNVSSQTVIASLFFRCVNWKFVYHILLYSYVRTYCDLRHECFVRTKLHRSMTIRYSRIVWRQHWGLGRAWFWGKLGNLLCLLPPLPRDVTVLCARGGIFATMHSSVSHQGGRGGF